MGIDLGLRGKKKNKKRTQPRSVNPYLRLAVKLYRFLSRRTDSQANQIILKRMFMSKTNRPPVSTKKLKLAARKDTSKIFVVVGTVTDDKRIEELPSLRVCALKFTETARARIVNANGECLTFDQLAMISPKAENTILIQGKRKARKCYKHFGKPISKKDKAKPYVRSKGRKFEKARGKLNRK